MTGQQGKTLSGKPARSEEDELALKRRNKWTMGEKSGSDAEGTENHPNAKEHGTHGESNVGEDALSGDEGQEFTRLKPE